MSSAELAGCFVDPALFCKLVLPHLKTSAGSSTTACSSCLMILAALLRGCNPELIKPHLKVWSPWKLYLSANHSDKFLFELQIHRPDLVNTVHCLIMDLCRTDNNFCRDLACKCVNHQSVDIYVRMKFNL